MILVVTAAACAPSAEPSKNDPVAPVAVKPAAPTTPDDFAVSRQDLQLKPFAVRLSLIASVLGVGVDHPLLAVIRDNRTELGDYDYANGVQPSAVWTAQKLALWTKSLRPVCASSEMRSRFPALPYGLDGFIEAAYGRNADDLDRAAFQETFAELELSDTERYEITCLAVLSSSELVLR